MFSTSESNETKEDKRRSFFNKHKRKMLPMLISALSFMPSKMDTEVFNRGVVSSSIETKKVPKTTDSSESPYELYSSVLGLEGWVEHFDLSVDTKKNVLGQLDLAKCRYNDTKYERVKGNGSLIEFMSNCIGSAIDMIPKQEMLRVERVDGVAKILAQIPEMTSEDVDSLGIDKYLENTGVSPQDVVSKVKKWIDKYGDGLSGYGVVSILGDTKGPLSPIESLYNRSEQSAMNSPFYDQIEGLGLGDVFGFPEISAEFIFGDVGCHTPTNKELDFHLGDKVDQIQNSIRKNYFSAEIIKKMENVFKENEWVVLDSGYRMLVPALNNFIELKLKLLELGYHIGISSSDEGGHTSSTHYLGSSYDLKAYRIVGTVSSEIDENKKVVVVVPVGEKDAITVASIISNAGYSVLNEHDSFSKTKESTGSHLHIYDFVNKTNKKDM